MLVIMQPCVIIIIILIYSLLFDIQVTISHSFFSLIGRESSIVQIMAVCEDQKFKKYVTPSQKISDEANRVTEMKFDASTNELLHDNFWT